MKRKKKSCVAGLKIIKRYKKDIVAFSKECLGLNLHNWQAKALCKNKGAVIVFPKTKKAKVKIKDRLEGKYFDGFIIDNLDD